MKGGLSFGDGHRSPHVSASLPAAECPSRQPSLHEKKPENLNTIGIIRRPERGLGAGDMFFIRPLPFGFIRPLPPGCGKRPPAKNDIKQKRQKQAKAKKGSGMAQLRVGVNGLGRIGRLLLRHIADDAEDSPLSIAAVNGRSPAEMAAHLIKYDSVHGVWRGEAQAGGIGKTPLGGISNGKSQAGAGPGPSAGREQARAAQGPAGQKSQGAGQALFLNGRPAPYFQESDPAKIPWRSHNADVVAECTGAFKSRAGLERHLAGGAKKVIVSAPAEGADFHLVFGVNHSSYRGERHQLISSSSCTTNCLAPVVGALRERFGFLRGFMTTVHSYTNDQNILDSSHKKDFRRARAAALNMIPTSTGAARAIGRVFPDLKGKIEGMAVRAPCPNVSLVDLTAEIKKPASKEELVQCFREAAAGRLKNILAVEEKPLVSSDFIGRRESAIVDIPCLRVLDRRLVKILAWYDNEAGFTQRIIDFLKFMAGSADL